MSQGPLRVTTNATQFQRHIDAISDEFQKKIMRAGVGASSQVFKKRAIGFAPTYRGRPRKGRQAGNLKKNIYVFRPRKQRGGEEHQLVSVREGKKSKKGDAFYWRWVEAGHRIVPRGHKITGGWRIKGAKRAAFDKRGGGRTRAFQFMEKAFTSGQGSAREAFDKRVTLRLKKLNEKKTPNSA